jgi:small-conductance mechanosensitive channel
MDQVSDFFTTTKIDGWDVILAVLVVGASFLVARAARRGALGVFSRVKGISPDTARIAANTVKYFVLLVGIGVALTFVGATVEPLTTAAIVAGVVAVLVLRGVAANFGAGLVLQTRGPFNPGDLVEVMGYVGVVKELNGRAVVLETDAGDTVFLPNGEVVSNAMINRSLLAGRRSELEVTVPLDRPPQVIHDLTLRAVATAGQVLTTPAPEALTNAIDSDRLTLRLLFFHRPADERNARSQVMDAVAKTLHEAGLTATVGIPPPIELPVLTAKN